MGITSEEPRGQLFEEAAETYTAFLLEAYGFERGEVEIPDAYRGRELDWFGDLNDALTELEDYAPAEVRRILTGRNPWVDEGASLLSRLRSGERREVRRILRRY
jgi:hypothetical protein